jgi:hypothetical protein
MARKTLKSGLPLGFTYSFEKSIDDSSSNPVGISAGGGVSTTASSSQVDIHNFRLNNASHQSYAILSSSTVPDPYPQNVPGAIGPALFADASGFALPAAGSDGGGRPQPVSRTFLMERGDELRQKLPPFRVLPSRLPHRSIQSDEPHQLRPRNPEYSLFRSRLAASPPWWKCLLIPRCSLRCAL